MKRILFGTDGSAGALAAARHLSHLPHHRDVHVHIVAALAVHDAASIAEAALKETEEALGSFPGHVTSAMSRADSTGEIVDILLATADYAEADLIAVGACGRSALDRFVIGSVAEGIARHADRPVLIARDSTVSPRVIVGVDGSEESRLAARFAARMLPEDRTLLLLHALNSPSGVVPTVDPVIAGAYYQAVEQQIATEQKEGARMLETLGEDIAVGGHNVDTLLTIGNPAAELIRVAEEQKAGLIVVGARGLTRVDRFLLGSVSERVVRHAHCSVIVFRRHTPDKVSVGKQNATC